MTRVCGSDGDGEWSAIKDGLTLNSQCSAHPTILPDIYLGKRALTFHLRKRPCARCKISVKGWLHVRWATHCDRIGEARAVDGAPPSLV
jgi:hypothetical protein